jgi:acetyltransferase
MFLANPQETLHGKTPRGLRGIDSGMSSNPTVRPYPVQYVGAWTTTGGMAVVIRPIRPEDEPLMVKFHGTLSEQSVYLRYFHMEKLDSRVAHERLVKKCFINYESEMALVADWQDPSTGDHEILAVGRMTKVPDVCEAEVAVLVSDQAQKQGLGTELVRRLIEVARDEKLERIIAVILPENYGMMALARHFRFTVRESADPSVVVAVLGLSPARV